MAPKKEKDKYLTREDVIRIVDERNLEFDKCFDKLINDVEGLKSSQKRIERALLGDKDFEDIGLAKMINVSYSHARRVDEARFMEKAEVIVDHWYRWEENGNWKILGVMIDKYKVLKVLTALVIGSGVISTANVITVVLKMFGIGLS